MPKEGQTIAGRFELIDFIDRGGQCSVFKGYDYTDLIIHDHRKDAIHPNIRTSGDGPFLANNIVDGYITQRLCRQLHQELPVIAIKFLHRIPLDEAAKESALKRFEIDYQTVKALNDWRIIKYIDYDIPSKRGHEGEPWIAMEYLPAGNLKKLIKDKQFYLKAHPSLIFFGEIIEAINLAHNSQPSVIHRDLKPENILIRDDGSPVISDFGICHVISDEFISLTGTDEEAGARNYIAPELRGTKKSEPTTASDYYSIGKVLYCMLSGGHVMDREDYESDEYDLRKLPGATIPINNIYDRIFSMTICEAKEKRFQSAGEIISEIDKISGKS